MLTALSYALLKKKVNYIVDADIRGFFDNLDKLDDQVHGTSRRRFSHTAADLDEIGYQTRSLFADFDPISNLLYVPQTNRSKTNTYRQSDQLALTCRRLNGG
jgi:hypothetical protein